MRLIGAKYATSALALLAGMAGVLPAAPAATAGFPLIAAYAAQDIGADPTSWIAVQDRSGVLHFGCRDLVSFDGDRWRATSMDGAHAIRGLAFSAGEERLWAGATGEIGWFDRAGDGSWNYHSLRQHIPAADARIGELWHAFAEPEGALFIADQKVLRWDGSSIRTWTLPGPRRLRALKVGDTIFLQHSPTGLHVIGPDGPELFLPASVLGDRGVFWLEARGPDWLVIAHDGLFVLSAGRLRPIAPESSELLRASSPTHVARLPDGRLAVGTVRAGIVVLHPDGSLDRTIGPEEGLPTRMINWLFVDRDGQLWATSFTHITRIAISSPSTIFDARSSLPGKPFPRLAGDHTGLYAATDDAVYHLRPGLRHFELFEPLHEHVKGLSLSPDGVLAAAFRSVKLIRDGVSTVLYSTPTDTFVAQRDEPGLILIADGRRIVEAARTGDTRILAADLPDNATSLARDWRGRLWLGTETHGILVADTQSALPATPRTAAGLLGLAPDRGAGMVRKAADGEILLLAPSRAWRLRRDFPGELQPVGNYPARTITAASEITPRGALWTIHAGGGLAPGVGVIATAGNDAAWQPHAVEGLGSIGVPRSIHAEETAPGTTILWIGGTSGVLRHVVEGGPAAPPPRTPLLRAMALGSLDSPRHPITGPLPFSTRSIEFEFATPEFARRTSLRMETRILPVDRDWVPADATSRRELSALRDGRYTFQVRAVAETASASEPASFRFEVLPPWWRTMPALFGTVLALVPLGYGLYWLRVRSLRRRNRELEAKVRQRTEELERASASKTQFVANMSHDIRNPLNGIVGLALALEETKLDQRQREVVATLRECTTYLSTLVDDVLDFASIEAGRVELRPRPYVPHELLRSIVTTLKADTVERDALLLVEADPSLPTSVLGDAGRIQQILVNYVSNALKYAGGHIRLAASIPPGSPDEIEFSVADEGPGLSEAEMATLFTKFSRLSRARREDIPGAGLGLAACRLLADIMGGSVGVESSPGRGARFHLRLPLTVASAEPEVVATDLPHANVLVVEDTDYNAWAAAAVLGKLGLSCERARTGGEALRLFEERRFNIVLLDRNLPDMDGTEVARRMRQLESDGRRAVLLAVTAYCTAEDRALCLESGMDAFVGKPLTPDKLRRVLLTTGRRQLAAASLHVSPNLAPLELDLNLLKYLSSGSAGGLELEVRRFLDVLDEGRAELARLVRDRELPALAQAAHRLVGHARMINAARLANALERLETAAAAGNRSALDERHRAVEHEIRAVREELSHPRDAAQPA